jgi:hypothetical protein
MATKTFEVYPVQDNKIFHMENDGAPFTADGDVSQSIDSVLFYPVGFARFSIQVVRSAGATNAVDVALQCSNDGTNWQDCAEGTVTDVTGGSGIAILTPANQMAPARYHRILCTTVGLGNNLKTFVTIV